MNIINHRHGAVVLIIFARHMNYETIAELLQILLNFDLYIMNHVEIQYFHIVSRNMGIIVFNNIYAFTRNGILHSYTIIYWPKAKKDEWFISPLLSAMGPFVRETTLSFWRKNVAKSIFKEYIGAVSWRDEDAEQLTKMFTDYHYAVPHDETVQLHAAADGIKKVYAYELHHRGPHSPYDEYDTTIGTHWVPHAEDRQFLFLDVPEYDPLSSEDDLKLREIMLNLWTNFAKFGNPTPSPKNGILWPAVPSGDNKAPSLNHLVLTPSPHMAQDSRCKVREFISSLQTEQNHNLYSSIEPEVPRCYALFYR
ncbi:unnamed protein product, partial [Meganyctiphanes norvegica]